MTHYFTPRSANASCASERNFSTFSRLFRPVKSSTPVWESTPAGRTSRIACLTFSGVRPPARITGRSESSAKCLLTRQS